MDSEWSMCGICAERYPDEDDALMHVNNEHGFHEQMVVLVDHDGNGQYSTPLIDEMFDSEYGVRTRVMRDVPQMERLSALVKPCYAPLEDAVDNTDTEER